MYLLTGCISVLVSTGERPFGDILSSLRYWVIHSITLPSLFLAGWLFVSTGLASEFGALIPEPSSWTCLIGQLRAAYPYEGGVSVRCYRFLGSSTSVTTHYRSLNTALASLTGKPTMLTSLTSEFIPEDWARQCNMGAARGLSMSDRWPIPMAPMMYPRDVTYHDGVLVCVRRVCSVYGRLRMMCS